MAHSIGDTLNAGKKLVRGESLTSKNGAYTATLQDDGNLVLEAGGKPIWATGTNGKDVARAEVQNDGNFVLYNSSDKPVWASDTKGKKDVRLVMQDDRNLVLYAADGAAWSTKTDTDAPPPAPAGDAGKPADAGPRTYKVVSGDTLFKIAERFYGDGNRYPEIAKASGIANPDLIMPGQELTIP